MSLVCTTFASERYTLPLKLHFSMETIYLDKLDEVAGDMPPCVATIGFFDGVHRGHQYLIGRMNEEARRKGLRSVVVTFDRHPRQVLQSEWQPRLLSTLDSKLLLLSKTRVDATVVVHFTKALARMSAQAFMEKVLKARLNVRELVIGYDNRFGHNRAESFDDYVRYGREMGIEVRKADPCVIDGVNVSSSVVREYVHEGNIRMANLCLGYPYTIAGKVVSGFQEGRKLGFPTANLDTSGYGQMVPPDGVYAIGARLMQSMAVREGMMNIGTRPTFDGKERTLEVNIFQFRGDLYGQQLLVSFYDRTREERKFASAEELCKQLQRDREQIQQLFENYKNNE